MDYTVDQLASNIVRSRLMGADEMKALLERWRSEAREYARDANRFLKWLSSRQHITEYQAGLLAKGHVDDFYLGPYKILDRLGRGRMAGVYRAVHRLGQVVAIKVLPPSRAKNVQLFSRFQREVKLAQKLKHPNVVRAFQVGETNGLHYLVMELLEGETLEDILSRRKSLPPQDAVRIAHQTLLGLQHIHEQGMVHRDIKPANLMVGPAPALTVKILDIGLARELFDDDTSSPVDQAELTREGVLLGTPDYMSPEQARDPRAIDIRADIYSLGCTLYHMLAGQPPFPDKNVLTQMVRHATEEPKPLREFNAQIPEGLEQILRWMMAKQATQRYPTPGRAAQALEVFLLAENPSASFEDSVEMKSYLTWLETGDRVDRAVTLELPVRPANPVAPVVPVATLPTPIELGELPDADTLQTRRPEEYDVELIPFPAPALPQIVEVPKKPTPLRDVILLLSGAGCMLLLLFAGVVIVSILAWLTS